MIASPLAVRSGALLLADTERLPALQDWLDRHGTLMAAALADPDVVRLEGRGAVALTPGPAGWADERWVVRHYHRGGAVAALLDDRYLRVGAPRPFQELRLLEAVRSRGVPAPEPLGATVHPAGLFYRGDLVTRWVPDSVDLATLLFGPPTPAPGGHPGPAHGEAALRSAGRLVRLLHQRGVEHPDLNMKNLLLVPTAERAARAEGVEGAPDADAPGGSAEPRTLVLDLDRARLHPGEVPSRTRSAMIDRFWRSARKWERRTGRALPLSLRQAFADGYSEGPGAESAG